MPAIVRATSAAALAELASVADEVHVVVTARDLGRVLPSAWQQRVKMGARQPYRRFLATVRRGEEGHVGLRLLGADCELR